MPIIQLILIGLGLVVIASLSEQARITAEKIQTDNYIKARKVLNEMNQLNPQVIDELFAKRDKLSPIVAQNLERFFKEKRG